ncbi:MAG: hypothetical protein K6G87_10430 [Butyrivibrio sp.]|uniref:hypothetical protein n=1 Tax=Butyrivibrio sp. TaxID=28121 RepID=UPI0025F5D7C2|nr:hypothetical protein [Butyrivibrio sp.]MCR5771632.1 hypothetical protein [Butyrivibrio sp.]
MIIVFILLVHLIVVLTIGILAFLNLIKIPIPFLAVVLWIPVFGPLCALIVHFYYISGRSGTKYAELENMKASLVWDEEEPSRSVESVNDIPLEDALILDDPSVRRSVMLDVLMENNSQYVGAISRARLNDDVEVVHYATTAMAEFSKEYELRLQQYATMYAEDHDNETLIENYADYLSSYIDSGLCGGQLLEIQVNTYQQLLRQLIKIRPTKKRYKVLASSYMDSGHLGLADELTSYLYDKYPHDEEAFTLRVRYYYETRQGDLLGKLIKECDSKDEYKSVELRNLISFWKEKEELQA